MPRKQTRRLGSAELPPRKRRVISPTPANSAVHPAETTTSRQARRCRKPLHLPGSAPPSSPGMDPNNKKCDRGGIVPRSPEPRSKHPKDGREEEVETVQGKQQQTAIGSAETQEEDDGVTREGPPPHVQETWDQRFSAAIKRGHENGGGASYVDQQHDAGRGSADPLCIAPSVDATVVGHWKDLSVLVASFAMRYRLRPGRWAGLEPKVREELLRWTPRAQEFLEDPARAEFIYAARIWHTLDEQILNADGPTRRQWVDEHWGRFSEMRDLFKEQQRPWYRTELDAGYNVWKWYTANLLQRVVGRMPREARRKAVARRIARDLALLAGASEEEMERWIPLLEDVCDNALLVDERMLLTATKYWVTWRPCGVEEALFGFHAFELTDEGCGTFMQPWETPVFAPLEDPQHIGLQPVRLVVRPALVSAFLFSTDLPPKHVAPMSIILERHGMMPLPPADDDGCGGQGLDVPEKPSAQ